MEEIITESNPIENKKIFWKGTNHAKKFFT